MRIGLAFLWVLLMVAPLIAQKTPHSVIAKNALPLAEQRTDASDYGNEVSVHQGAAVGKLR
jgi:hypothetical protein